MGNAMTGLRRDERRWEKNRLWDMIVVGGGATGVGVAVDAASRGFAVLLLEQSDFGKGTSSRSTKLVHGGVRYLEQGNLALVMEALRERGLLRRNAPHLVHDLAFVIPRFQWWEGFFYGLGLKAYQLLSGKYRFGPSLILSRAETLARLPNVRSEGLRGGVLYHDGQFDDARLLINLAVTAAEQGATLANYVQVTGLTQNASGRIDGVRALDLESGQEFTARARIVINATGAFGDKVRRFANPRAAPLIAASQGIHLVFPRSFLPGDAALMVPRTSDGRVMFAIPWLGHTLVGTTDTPLDDATLEPLPREEEISFLLETAGRYLHKAPTRADVLSVFTGIRPLVRRGKAKNTAALSRDHTIHFDPSGLLTITGGKWTTYRNMAEDCVNQAIHHTHLPPRRCQTRHVENSRLPPTIRPIRHLGGLRRRRPGHPRIDSRRPRPGRALASRLTLLRRRSSLGGTTRNGTHRGRCARSAHPSAFSQCRCGANDGSPSGGIDGQGVGSGLTLAGGAGQGIRTMRRVIIYRKLFHGKARTSMITWNCEFDWRIGQCRARFLGWTHTWKTWPIGSTFILRSSIIGVKQSPICCRMISTVRLTSEYAQRNPPYFP